MFIKKNYTKGFLILVLVTLLTLCSGVALADTSTTIMMYICGTDLQSQAVEDLYEMCSVDLPSNVNISVHAGGTAQWDDSRLSGYQNNRFYIQDNDFQDIYTIGSDSMGESQTLQSFITDSVAQFPADRYILILWDHGGGATNGVCFDETANDDYLTMNEIYSAIYLANEETGIIFDIIGFDACLMGTVETAMHLSYHSYFMIASEELEPGTGWAYDEWLPALADDPYISTEDLGKEIVDTFIDVSLSYYPDDYITLSLIDLFGMSVLLNDLNDFAYYLTEALDNGELSTFSRARKRMYSFGSFYDASSDMVDLEQFVDAFASFAPTTAASLKNKIQNVVAYSASSGQYDYACGLSILMPQDTTSDFNDYVNEYDRLNLMSNYKQFLQGYVAMLQGGSYQFSLSTPERIDSETATDAVFTFTQNTMPTSSYVAETTTEETATSATSSGGFFGEVTDDTSEEETTSTGASSGGFFDAIDTTTEETQETQETQETGTTTASSGGFFGAIDEGYTSVGNSQTTIDLSDTDSIYAYALTLSEKDMSYLSYVEGSLWMDISDEDGEFYIDLGYLQNAFIDWENNTIYSMFDGTWPCLEGQLIPMYDQSVTEKSRRSLLSVMVNDLSCYLIIVFDEQSPEGRITGYSEGYDENGIAVRGTTALEVGDVVYPEYPLYYYEDPDDDQLSVTYFLGDPIVVDEDGLSFQYESLAEDGEIKYWFSFFLNDIFGDFQESEGIEFYL